MVQDRLVLMILTVRHHHATLVCELASVNNVPLIVCKYVCLGCDYGQYCSSSGVEEITGEEDMNVCKEKEEEMHSNNVVAYAATRSPASYGQTASPTTFDTNVPTQFSESSSVPTPSQTEFGTVEHVAEDRNEAYLRQ